MADGEPAAKRARTPNRLRGVVIADDMTGACDSALAVANTGLRPVILLLNDWCICRFDSMRDSDGSRGSRQQRLKEIKSIGEIGVFDILVLCSRTRHIGHHSSTDWMHDFYDFVCEHVLKSGIAGAAEVPVYLKVDSTLRGSVSKDLCVAMERLGCKRCVMAPALPQAGRTTDGGVQLLNGAPVPMKERIGAEETSVEPQQQDARPRGEPLPASSHIESILKADPECFTGAEFKNLSSANGETRQEAFLKEAADVLSMAGKGEKVTVVIADAAEQDDLNQLAMASRAEMQRSQAPLLLAGSAGFASTLPIAWGIEGKETGWKKGALPTVHSNGSVTLVVIGSESATCQAQLQHMCKNLAKDQVMTLDVARIDSVETLLQQLGTFPRPRVVVLRKVGEPQHVNDPNLVTPDWVSRLAIAAADELGSRLAGLVVSGGHTLHTMLAMCHDTPLATHLEVTGEIGSCTPVLRMVGGRLDGVSLVTKGGSLGEEDVFFKAVMCFSSPDTSKLKPILALTMGDVAGIGPEIIAKALCHAEAWEICRPIVVGSADALAKAAEITMSDVEPLSVDDTESINWNEILFSVQTIASGKVRCTVPVVSAVQCNYGVIELGKVNKDAGRCAAEWVIQAVDLCMKKHAAAIVTAPLNKESMNKGGYKFAGHTELLAKYSGARTSRLMLASEKLRVVHATGHCSLADVPKKLTQERLADTIVMAGEFLRCQDIANPRIAVAGLNPHAGDGGLFGNEETEVLMPAIEQCRGQGWTVSDPLPSDTVFCRAVKGEFDVVVAMYHDQGHIAAKLVDFEGTINVTLGLPIIRTSVDHGTAFDIAGKGIAKESNLLHAMRLAAKMVPQSRKGV